MRAAAARGRRAGRRRDHRRGAQLRATRSAARWARPSATRCSSRSAASCPWPAAAAAPTPHARPPRRSRAPTSSAAARPAAAAPPTRCWRRTGSAPGSPGARCRRPPCATGWTPRRWSAFAELVFAYIDELSAASVAGHTDELATTGRVRQRLLERVARHLLTGAPGRDRSSPPPSGPSWEPPTHADRGDRARGPGPAGARRALPRTLQAAETAGARRRRAAAGPRRARPPARRAAADARATAAPSPARRGRGSRSRASYDRALRARELGLEADTEAHLAELVLHRRPGGAGRPARAGAGPARRAAAGHRREARRHPARLAAAPGPPRGRSPTALFVHPQTVRYRMGQLRELYGDRLDDPDSVLALTVALGVEPRRRRGRRGVGTAVGRSSAAGPPHTNRDAFGVVDPGSCRRRGTPSGMCPPRLRTSAPPGPQNRRPSGRRSWRVPSGRNGRRSAPPT